MAEKELSDAIKKNAEGPLSASDQQGSIQQHKLLDQIEADQYLASKKAARKGLGIRHVKLIPPGMD